jgi:membrane glycosyltransferase
MADILPHKGSTPIEMVIVVLFGALFAWILVGFWAAMMGFWLLVRRYNRFGISQLLGDMRDSPFSPTGRTAILFPICNENFSRVAAGLKATYRSLEAHGGLAHFDFYLLSDSGDQAIQMEEEAGWAQLCRDLDAFGRVFYRRRRVNLKRKNGNIADFCRRWGADYRYMVVMDADSVMSGEALVKLVFLMEARRHVGIIQTAPVTAGCNSLFARVNQFAGKVYGPMFAAGLHFWQLGDSQYWGHNAIIRIAPFMAHCALPRLGGTPPLGGDILSHDFVESALMRRAGWGVWLAHDLPGSYEEMPPTLLNELKRDRRWCQGNLQHLRLLFTRGLYPAHRALFVQGIMTYVSALLWFCFLVLSSAEAIMAALQKPQYFPSQHTLFPDWHVWHPQWALTLLALTGVVLFLPKLFSALLILAKNREVKRYGGRIRLLISVLLEIALSTLLAPVRMLFHTKFVFLTLLGLQVKWSGQQRGDAATGWWDSLRQHGFGSLLAVVWGTAIFLANPAYFWWLTPIIGSLVLSVPISVYSSRVGPGLLARRLGLFLTPEETATPTELLALYENLRSDQMETVKDGFVRAVVDPYMNALHRRLVGRRGTVKESIAIRRAGLRARALARGPQALSKGERAQLLEDPESMKTLHDAVWALDQKHQAAKWGVPA